VELSRRHVLAGLGALSLGGWRQAAEPGAAFSGTLRRVGPGQTYATIAAALAAASDFDRIVVDPAQPAESLTINKSILLDFRGCVWDFNHVPPGSLAGGGKGAIELFAPNILVYPGEITGVGTDNAFWTGGDLTSAIRISSDGAGSVNTVVGGFLHDNQNGIGSSNPAVVRITVANTRLLHNGLPNNTGSLTHNAYFGAATSVTLINVDSRNPLEAHAIKCRASNLYSYGGFYESLHGACVDMPEGGYFEWHNTTIQKLATADSNNCINYATESTNQGLNTSNSLRYCVMDLQSAAAIHTLGGVIYFLEGNTSTSHTATFFGGGNVVGIP
jgi:hypothetical protein